MNLKELKNILDNESETSCFCFKITNYCVCERIMIDQNSDVSKLLLDKGTYNIIHKSYKENYLLNFNFDDYQNFNLKEPSEEIKINAEAYHLSETPKECTWIKTLSDYMFKKDDYICLAAIESRPYIFILRKSRLLSDIRVEYNNEYLPGEPKRLYKCKVTDCNNYESENIEFPRCNICKKVKYCSRNCQVKDWNKHKLTCGPLLSDIPIEYDNEYSLEEPKRLYKCKVTDCNNYEIENIEFPHCNTCKKVKYCSRRCQVKDWNKHKLICGK